jgi:hypothetical protein
MPAMAECGIPQAVFGSGVHPHTAAGRQAQNSEGSVVSN